MHRTSTFHNGAAKRTSQDTGLRSVIRLRGREDTREEGVWGYPPAEPSAEATSIGSDFQAIAGTLAGD